jgi:hypothetical protein
LNKIEHTLKKNQSYELEIKNLYINPFNFITQDFQILTYDKCEKICNELSLNIDFKIKIEKWSYDLFLRVKKSIYLTVSIYNKELKKFCEQRQQNHNNFLEFINKIIIDKKINGEIYKTTEYLINIEKTCSDLVMDLYYDKKYDISIDKLNQYINEYEHSKQFTLESEQRTGVINAIINKLSIITGPPGTGKTEILLCINYVLYKLYKENEEINTGNETNSDDASSDDDDNIEDEDEDDDDDLTFISEENSNTHSDYISDDENKIFDEENNKFISPKTIGLVAPTGLAYVNMECRQQAKHYNVNISGTCHRVLYNIQPNIFQHKYKCNCRKGMCKYNLDLKLLELDEVSMLDIFIFKDILELCKKFKARLILLGDVEQLPSIGPGKVLFQLIKCDLLSVTQLNKIKRQNAGCLVNNILKMSKEIITRSDFIDDTMIFRDIDEFILPNRTINTEAIINLINTYNLNRHTKFISGFKDKKFIFNTHDLNYI